MSAGGCIPRLRFALPAALLASLVFASSAGADTVEVNTNADHAAGCTLRDAIESQNQGTGVNDCDLVVAADTDTITFAPSVSGQAITLNGGGALAIDDPGGLEIVGPGMDELTVDGNGLDRVFLVLASRSAVISGLTVTGGDVNPGVGDAVGGGIDNLGDLTLSDVLVAGNSIEVIRAGDAFSAGGGIYNGGSLRLDDSAVVANTSTATSTDPASSYAMTRGAGVHSAAGSDLKIMRSTIADNVADASFDGMGTTLATGGLDSFVGFQARNSTFSGNTASAAQDGTGLSSATGGISAGGDGGSLELSTVAANIANVAGAGPIEYGGGILSNAVALRIESSTIAFNGPATGDQDGANLVVGSGSATLSNTIVSNPRGGGINCLGFADLTSLGFNSLYPDITPGCFVAQPTDQMGIDPLLATAGLADNGGPTATIGLQPLSPAIDAGSHAGAIYAFNEPISDQRGLARPVLFPAIPTAADSDGSDIGAFEVQRACPTQQRPSESCSPATDPGVTTGQRSAARTRCKKHRFKGKARAAKTTKRKKCLAGAARLPV